MQRSITTLRQIWQADICLQNIQMKFGPIIFMKYLVKSSSGSTINRADFSLQNFSASMAVSKQRICSISESRKEFNRDSTVESTDAMALFLQGNKTEKGFLETAVRVLLIFYTADSVPQHFTKFKTCIGEVLVCGAGIKGKGCFMEC